MTGAEADDFEGKAEVDALLAEFDGDARAPLKALLHDLEVLARDYSADISRGHVRREKPQFVMRWFGRFNDQHGHHVGDLMLRQIGRTINDCILRRNLACRIGCDEFALIASDIVMDGGQIAGAAARGDRRRFVRGRRWPAGPGHGQRRDGGRGVRRHAQTLFARADAALYAPKRGGRNRVSLAA